MKKLVLFLFSLCVLVCGQTALAQVGEDPGIAPPAPQATFEDRFCGEGDAMCPDRQKPKTLVPSLESLNSNSGQECTKACTTNKACDANCVKACESCKGSCGKMCTKKSLYNFVCGGDDDDDDTKETKKKNAAADAAQKCLDDNSDAITKCTSGTSSAGSACATEGNPTLSSAVDVIGAVALGIGAYTGASVQAACSQMGTISETTNGALAAYRLACSNGQSSCSSSCSSAKSKVDSCANKANNSSDVKSAMNGLDDYKAITGAASKCKALASKVDQANQAMQNIAATAKNANGCQAATAGMMNAAAAQDCSNPTFAATNQVCLCQANPRLPGCGGAGASSTPSAGMEGLGSSAASASSALPTNLPSATPDTNLQELKAHIAGEDVGGKKGGGAPIGGASAFDGVGQNRGAVRGEDTPKYGTAGYYGSNSGGGGESSGRSRGSHGYGLEKESSAKPGGPDLRSFLPGGKADPTRGIAGMTGPDGITGPNTNIWEKVQNRYRNQTPSLYLMP